MTSSIVRGFLEIAIYVSPSESSATLRRVYESRGSSECGDILEFMLEHIALPTNAATSVWSKLNFRLVHHCAACLLEAAAGSSHPHDCSSDMTTDRSYFKVLSDILLGPGLASISSYQPIVQKLVNKVVGTAVA